MKLHLSCFFFSSRRRHTRWPRDWSSDVCSSDLTTLTEATRNHELIVQGVSPRGALALSRIAKAHAYISGRDFVVPEDVIAMFVDTRSEERRVGKECRSGWSQYYLKERRCA